MKYYLLKLLPRIKQFSQDLDKKEVFVDIPWVILDEHQNQQKYIFKRNGELLMSYNGQVNIGKWEYLTAAKSLLIDRVADKILLKQNFVDPAVMVLQKDGVKDENFILANEILLPDLDVIKYLKSLYYEKNNILIGELTNGENLEFNDYNGYINGNTVTIDGEQVPDGILNLAKSARKLVIQNSKVIKVIVKQLYTTNKGNVIIEKVENCSPAKGDVVYSEEGAFVPDGKYKIGFLKYITVENGIIIK